MLINNNIMNGPLGYTELNIENFENSNKIEQLRNEISSKKSKKCKKSKPQSNAKHFKPIEPNSGSELDSDSECEMEHDQDDTHTSHNSDKNTTVNEPFTEMPSEYAKQYYNQYIPYTNGTTTNENDQSGGDLLKKLNYMIHLLEDQKDEKVEGITEELVLFCFLGIFIIFIIDSFTRVGKYIR